MAEIAKTLRGPPGRPGRGRRGPVGEPGSTGEPGDVEDRRIDLLFLLTSMMIIHATNNYYLATFSINLTTSVSFLENYFTTLIVNGINVGYYDNPHS